MGVGGADRGALTVILETILRGARASITLDGMTLNRSLSLDGGGYQTARQGSISLVGNRHATYGMLYRSQPWVHIAVNRIARGIGRLPIHVYDGATNVADRARVREGPLFDLVEDPYEGGTPSLFKQGTLYNLLIHGNSIAVKARPGPGRPPTELLPSDFSYWTIDLNEARTAINWYVFHGPRGQEIAFYPDEVLHFKPWAAGAGLVAESPLEPLRQTLMLEDATQRALIAAYENGMRPIGAYSIDGTFKDRATAERNRAQLQETYGGVDRAYRIMLLEGGAKWHPMTQTWHDAEVVNLRAITRDETVAVFNIPPPAVGILDDATYSNITEQHLMEYQDTYSPWTKLIEEVLQLDLVAHEPTMRGQFVEFNFHEVLRGDPLKELAALQTATGGPIMTPNEARAVLNLPQLPGGDVLNQPQGAAPAAAGGEPAPARPPARR